MSCTLLSKCGPLRLLPDRPPLRLLALHRRHPLEFPGRGGNLPIPSAPLALPVRGVYFYRKSQVTVVSAPLVPPPRHLMHHGHNTERLKKH